MRKLLIILVGLLLAGGGDAWCAHGAEKAKGPGRPKDAAQAGPGKKTLALGTIEPEKVAEVYAQVPGTIVSLGADPQAPGKLIDYGSAVEKGTVLAQIDSELYAVRVEGERAGCARAEAELAQATINLERAEAHWQTAQERKKSNAVSDADFDSARFDYRLAKASVAVAEAVLAQNKAALKTAEIELGYTTIRSPMKGVVIARRASAGQPVGPQNVPSLFLIADLSRLEVWASVIEADIMRIRPQQSVRFAVDAHPGKVFEGKVKQIRLNAAMTRNAVTYTVIVAISGAKEELLPYMTAQLEFE